MPSYTLVIVDPQNSFLGEDDGSPYKEELKDGRVRIATLPVKGGRTAMKKVGKFVKRTGRKLKAIRVTLDSHHDLDVADTRFVRNTRGQHPDPFTVTTADDLNNNIWTVRSGHPSHQKRMTTYVGALRASGREHRMWPAHCNIGTWGHNIEDELREVLAEWELNEFATVDYTTKGSAVWEEHFGGVEAEIPDDDDQSTQPNMEFIRALSDSDFIIFVGLALDYCVGTTIRQVHKHLGANAVKKFIIFTDCTKAIDEAAGLKFLAEMKALGATITTSDAFLA